MKDKHPSPKLTAEELQLIQRLREHPELMDRFDGFRSILEISTSGAGPLKRADEVEELLIEEMRRLGKLENFWRTASETFRHHWRPFP